MRLIPFAEIQEDPTRQRQFYDEMRVVDLADSIVENGLINAISVQQSDGKTLVAGGRRCRAIEIIYRRGQQFYYDGTLVPTGMVPVSILSASEAAAYYAAELEENIQREGLTWQEEASARARLHELRSQQTGGQQTIKATAEELQINKENMSNDLVLSRFLADEDVAKAKTRQDAMKILKQKTMKEHHKKLAEEFQIKKEEKQSQHTILCGDSIQLMKEIPNGTYDGMVTDPPFGIDADAFGDQSSVEHDYDDSYETWQYLANNLAKESYRICKHEAHAYVFCDIRNFSALQEYFELAGWYVWATPLIWDKGNVGLLPRPEHGPRRCYEVILYAIKGNKKTLIVQHDVIRVPGISKSRHSDEKPVEVYENLAKRSFVPGNKIIDPFCGAAGTIVVGNRLMLEVTVIDIDEVNTGIAVSRLEEK